MGRKAAIYPGNRKLSGHSSLSKHQEPAGACTETCFGAFGSKLDFSNPRPPWPNPQNGTSVLNKTFRLKKGWVQEHVKTCIGAVSSEVGFSTPKCPQA